MRFSICCLMTLGLTLASGINANAGVVIGTPFLVSNSGVGFGAAPPVLTLQATPNESGGVAWNGTSDDKTGDFVTNQTTTVTAAEVSAIATTNLGIFFNINDAGNPKQVTLDDMTVTLYRADGSSIATGSIDAGLLAEAAGGVGGDGWFFPMSAMTTEFTEFFSNPANRLGIAANIFDSSDGPDSFRVATAVPEPSAMFCLALVGLLGSGGSWIRKKFLG